ncbi:hypothetical protein ACWIDJ_16080, partial [Brevundimonas naejangsanensis]
ILEHLIIYVFSIKLALKARFVTIDHVIIGINVNIDAFPDAFVARQKGHFLAEVGHGVSLGISLTLSNAQRMI